MRLSSRWVSHMTTIWVVSMGRRNTRSASTWRSVLSQIRSKGVDVNGWTEPLN